MSSRACASHSSDADLDHASADVSLDLNTCTVGRPTSSCCSEESWLSSLASSAKVRRPSPSWQARLSLKWSKTGLTFLPNAVIIQNRAVFGLKTDMRCYLKRIVVKDSQRRTLNWHSLYCKLPY